MSKIVKGMVVLSTILVFCFVVNVMASGSLSNSELPDDISSQQQQLAQEKVFADIYYKDKKIELNEKPYFATGRFYVPFEETVNGMGGSINNNTLSYTITFEDCTKVINKTDRETYPKVFIDIDNVRYISLFELINDTKYCAYFNLQASRVDIKLSNNSYPQTLSTASATKTSYIRLEDVMADGVDPNGYYTHEGLEKLRAEADYLYQNGQRFYIAWIPLYKNPKLNIENDLTSDFNLYNADFLYTLDYLVSRGGVMGVHGYTHQYNDDVSADGLEFGSNTPFSDKECVNRMLAAKQIARDLGYNVGFFEFPHYAATLAQMRYAEKYFDVIYQQDVTTITKGYIATWTRANGKVVKYVPTPADYVYSRYDINGIFSRIDNSIKTNQIVSLFYHPRIDFEVMTINDTSDTREVYLTDSSALSKVVNKVISSGYSFGCF